jgi:hypothetical protein|tara:strand:+ start:302 stop:712 length:411 start_codon:yes stop_codon:yes gene_type:complete
MESSLIIYPGFAVVVLTFLLYTKNRIEVGKAYSKKSIKGSYLKLYQDIPPEHVEISRQTLKNQFELPVLFYFLVVLLYAEGTISQIDIIFAWIFAVSRYIHAYIRLSTNYIPRRAMIFIVGMISLLAGWVNFIIRL